jgi:hypothetical protein
VRDSRTMRAHVGLMKFVVASATALVMMATLSPPSAVSAPATSRKSASVTTRKSVKRTTTKKRRSVTTAAPVTVAVATVPSTLPTSVPSTTAAIATTLAPTTAASTTLAATIPPTTVAPFAFTNQIQNVSVPLGATVTFPVWLTVRTGFNEAVTLVAVDQPGGVSMSFEQNPIRNYTAASVTVTQGSGVLPVITLEGRSAGFTAKSKIVITVIAGPGSTTSTIPIPAVTSKVTSPSGAFSVTITQVTTPLVKGGDAVSYKMTIQRSTGVTGPAAMGISSAVPAGIITSFEQNTVAGTDAYLFARAGTLAASGSTFAVAVTVTLGSETVIVYVSVSVA